MAIGKINPSRICSNGKGTGFNVMYNGEVIIQYDDKKITLDEGVYCYDHSLGLDSDEFRRSVDNITQINHISDKLELGFRIHPEGNRKNLTWKIEDTTYITHGMKPSSWIQEKLSNNGCNVAGAHLGCVDCQMATRYVGIESSLVSKNIFCRPFVGKISLDLPVLDASYLVLRYNARYYKNGNPRRVYVVYKDSDIDTIYNEGHAGSDVVFHPHHWRALKKSGMITNIDVSEYKEFLKMDAVEPESLKN